MRKFFRTITLGAFAAAAVLSCSKEEVSVDTPTEKPTDNKPVVQSKYYHYSFDVNEQITRAVLEYDGVYWEENDAVGMYLNNNHTEANIDITTSPKTIFLNSTSSIPPGSQAYAYYPYDERNTSLTSTIVGIPHEQVGGAVSAMPMVGIPFTVQSGDTNGEVYFLNLGAIIDFKVFSTSHTDETVRYITLRNNAENIAGDAVIDLSSVDPEKESTLAYSGWGTNKYNQVTVRRQVAVASSKENATSIYMVVAPGEYVSGTITIGTDKAVYTFNYSNKPLTRNELKHYNMNLDSANATREILASVPYSVDFTADMDLFSTDGAKVNNNAVWKRTNDYGMKATAYYGTAYASESWLYSPWIDLRNVPNASLGFEHVHRFGSNPSADLTMWIKTDADGDTWHQLTIPTYASGSSWDDWKVVEGISLYSYVGHKVQIGFKYVSTADAAATWEIKNFAVELADAPEIITVEANFTWDLSVDQTYTATAQLISWLHAGTGTTMAATKGTTTNANNYYPGTSGQSYKSTRFYTGATLTITPGGDITVTSVVFTATTDDYAEALRSSSWTGATATRNQKVVTVTPTNGTAAISAAIGGTCGFTSVKVNYTYETISGGGDQQTVAGLQYLGCIEVPALSLIDNSECTDSGTETFGSTSWFAYNTTTSSRRVATHTYSYNSKTYRNYTVLVDQTKRCPLWVAYPMHKVAYPSNSLGRAGSFKDSHSYDPAFPDSWQSSGSTSDYNGGNGYARGHMCASADRQAVEEANEQTFYYTNQCPQWQNSFNSGVWSSLEEAVQNNAPSALGDTLYVVSGVLFETGNSGSSNDGGTVGRPSHFYKLLMRCTFSGGSITAAQGVAYLYTNEAHTGVNYNSNQFRTTIAAIESRAGFNFFPNVPTALHAENMSDSLW